MHSSINMSTHPSVPVATTNRICLICGEPTNIARLGVDSCRACASFFERASKGKRKLVCRQGDKKCLTRKYDKFACRSCRYDKCVELGMAYVQRWKKKAKSETAETETPSTSFSSEIARGLAADSLLLRMETEYKASYERRVTKEKEYAAMHNLPRVPHPNEELYIGSFSLMCELFRITINESAPLLHKVFGDFENVLIDHKVTLFKHFMIKFSMTECVYYSNRYFKRSDCRFMASLVTCCANFHDMDKWTTDVDSQKHGIVNKGAFRSTLKDYANDYVDLFDAMAKMEQLTEREFYALTALNYCDVDSLDLPEEIIQTAQKTRVSVFHELQVYYRNELKLPDYSKRLGNLMTLAHGIREAGYLVNEEMRMYTTMFDLYCDDKLFREFFTE